MSDSGRRVLVKWRRNDESDQDCGLGGAVRRAGVGRAGRDGSEVPVGGTAGLRQHEGGLRRRRMPFADVREARGGLVPPLRPGPLPLAHRPLEGLRDRRPALLVFRAPLERGASAAEVDGLAAARSRRRTEAPRTRRLPVVLRAWILRHHAHGTRRRTLRRLLHPPDARLPQGLRLHRPPCRRRLRASALRHRHVVPRGVPSGWAQGALRARRADRANRNVHENAGEDRHDGDHGHQLDQRKALSDRLHRFVTPLGAASSSRCRRTGPWRHCRPCSSPSPRRPSRPHTDTAPARRRGPRTRRWRSRAP